MLRSAVHDAVQPRGRYLYGESHGEPQHGKGVQACTGGADHRKWLVTGSFQRQEI